MKKIASLLTFVLVLALAVPAFAADVEITGETTTTYDKYEGDIDALQGIWNNDDILDEDEGTEIDDYVFNQELDFNLVAEGEKATVDVALGTVTNEFGVNSDDSNFDQNLALDTATVTADSDLVTVKAGDLSDYGITNYFVNEKDLEGVEVSTDLNGFGVKGLKTADYKALEGNAAVAGVDLTGRYMATGTDKETTYAVEGETDLQDATLTGEFATNEDNLVRAGVEMPFAGGTATAGLEMIGEDFELVKDDDLDTDKTEYTVGVEALPVVEGLTVDSEVTHDDDATVEAGATYVVSQALSVNGKYTLETADGEDNTIEAGATLTPSEKATLEGNMEQTGDYVKLTANGNYDLTDALALNAEYVNENAKGDSDVDTKYNYLEGGVEYKVDEDVTLNGTGAAVSDEDDNTSYRAKTELNVNF